MESPTPSTAVLDELLAPFGESLTSESAKVLATFRVSAKVQQRVDELAAKSNEGTLSDSEQSEYQSYVTYGNVLATIKAKAKAVLAGKTL